MFDDIKARLGACHIVIVSTKKEEHGDIVEVKAMTRTGKEGDEGSLNAIEGGELGAPESSYADVVREARENGFRRNNCAARMMFFEALELSYLVGYMSPDENIDVKTDAARAEDLRSEEGRLRRRD